MNINLLSFLNELVKSTLRELPYRITAAAFSLASGDNTRQITAYPSRRCARTSADKNLGLTPKLFYSGIKCYYSGKRMIQIAGDFLRKI